eukprot:2430619-Prymnesium_polylepis.1
MLSRLRLPRVGAALQPCPVPVTQGKAALRPNLVRIRPCTMPWISSNVSMSSGSTPHVRSPANCTDLEIPWKKPLRSRKSRESGMQIAACASVCYKALTKSP